MSTHLAANPPTWTQESLTRELGIAPKTLRGWEKKCPYLGGEPLRFTWVKVTRVGKPFWAKSYNPDQVRQIVATAREAATGRVVIKGRAWLSEARALRELRVGGRAPCRDTLFDWHGGRAGCPHLGGKKLIAERLGFHRYGTGKGQFPFWYPEVEILQVKESLQRGRRCYGTADEPRLSKAGVRERYGWDKETLTRMEKAGQLEAVPDRAKHGCKRTVPTYRAADLERLKEARQHPLSRTHEHGQRLSLEAASEWYGVSTGRLRRYVKKTRFHPDGRLPAEVRKNPRHGKTELTVLHTDMALLIGGFRSARQRALPPGRWLSARRLADHFYQRGQVRERILLFRLLRALRERGRLRAEEVVREAGKQRRWVSKVLYDLNQVEQVLAGTTPEKLLASLPSAASPGEVGPDDSPRAQASPAADGQRRPARGGRPATARTWEIYRLCYELYVRKDKKAAAVKVAVNDRFGPETIKEVTQVRQYARRYARKFHLPTKQQNSQEK